MAELPLPATEVLWEGPVISGRLVQHNDIRTVATPEGSGNMKPTIVGHTLTLHVYPIDGAQQPDSVIINDVRYSRK